MKTLRTILTLSLVAIIGFGCTESTQKNATVDPLDQWNEGQVKTSILNFVQTITDETNPNFIPVEDRVAVFDMDGTFLLEKPNPVNFDFILKIMTVQMTKNSELKQKQPYKAISEQDWAYFDTLAEYGDDGLYGILLTATDGYSDAQFRRELQDYFNTAIDKRFNKPYNQLVYVPMAQLVKYLQDNKFEVYIVSGSDPEFTRGLCEDAINIPVRNVLGSTVLTKWVETDSGSIFIREHRFVEPINDQGGKAVNILNKVGKVPVIAVGNSPGDYPMLEYSKNSSFSLQVIVNHDDSLREYYYDTDKMHTMCQENGWQEISMKNDFKKVFQ